MWSSAGKIKRPPAITAGSATIPDEVSPWTSLPADLVRLVGWRVLARDLLDYVRFRATCTHWRSSTVCLHGRGIIDPRFHPRRWMILPEGHGLHPRDGTKRFFNPSTGSFVRVRLPLLADHWVLETVDGLLLLQPDHRDKAAMGLLLHPFTGDTVKLPPLMPLLESYYWWLIPHITRYRWVDLNFVATLSVSTDGVPVLMIAHQDISRVFFATTDDQQWRVSTWKLPPLSESISFQGKLYILGYSPMRSSGQQILRLDPPRHEHAAMSSSLLPPTLIATCPTDEAHVLKFSLVECDSEILLIGIDYEPIVFARLVVYRVVDLAIGKVTPVKSIRGNTIFLHTRTSSMCISKSMTSSYKTMPTVPSDAIVYKRPNNYPWQYHLGNNEWSEVMGACDNDCCYKAAGGCNCGLIYHIYRCCHCTDEQESSYFFKA